MRQVLPTQFASRSDLVAQVVAISPDLLSTDAMPANKPTDRAVSDILGGADEAELALQLWSVRDYGQTRNHLDGAVSGLSPYLRHGVLTPHQLQQACLAKLSLDESQKFLQQLSWRDYYHHIAQQYPEWLWQDVESYKTGFSVVDYAEDLPADVLAAQTPEAFINQLIEQLYTQGYLHNHARLYLASYLVHWRRVKWQVGARWMLRHLLDGDTASNNLSWQWVASTFSAKPYIFNLDNVVKFAGAVTTFDLTPANNPALDASYETLQLRLFPNLTAGE
ncbi:FAD-binding domain-containing protein [Thiomicrospira cyclica]|uniref:DNA photolyase FAD-binding protein n=1 Tax=Thiomicrospira cyclica (strain DSM 14477 / JCM 11371 / ALM1) TaxID=717773 RepID=F6D9C7_THICA|nr:FAD-binding domain-containing protein [Thiomicrospira cyclica]AEG32054.1 DNA photolyase FAD-binding protein [Thiomicrospira cyclica ALM1]